MSLNQAIPARVCARCRYDLASQLTGVPIITCPECGSQGTPEQICDPILPPLPHWGLVAAKLSGPTIAMCLVCVVLTALRLDMFLLPTALLTFLSGPFVPFVVGGSLAVRHSPGRRRHRLAIVLIAAGLAMNLVLGAFFLVVGVAIVSARGDAW